MTDRIATTSSADGFAAWGSGSQTASTRAQKRIRGLFASVATARVPGFLDRRLDPLMASCGVDSDELRAAVRRSWEFVAEEAAVPACHERLWAKRVLYVHRRGKPQSDGARAYRIGVTDDPARRNAVKRSEDSGYLPFFEITGPLCDAVEVSLQTLLLPFASNPHATNRRASCFCLPDSLALELCRFVQGFYGALLGLEELEPASEPNRTRPLPTPCADPQQDPRKDYFREARCRHPSCDKMIPLARSRKRCPLHARAFRLETRVVSLRKRARAALKMVKTTEIALRRLRETERKSKTGISNKRGKFH